MAAQDEKRVSSIDFTGRAGRQVREALRDPDFRDADMDVIYETLKEKVQILSFGDHLKRYLYRKAGMSGDYLQIPPETYRTVLCNAFKENQTPGSFTPTTSKLSTLAKNWISQKAVSRNVVFLLGFGLKMTLEDVDGFLTKVLMEQRINAKDPFETICWYCLHNDLGFSDYERLWNQYLHLDRMTVSEELLESTYRYKRKMTGIRNEQQLMNYLLELPQTPGARRQSVAARAEFDRLYEEACGIIAGIQTEMARESSEIQAERMQAKLSRSDALYDYQKQEIIDRKRDSYQQASKENIGAADIEQWLFASVPKDTHGNLLPMKQSGLNEQFAGKRLNRQHIGEILAGKAPITRYDLITLHFFVFSQDIDRFRKMYASNALSRRYHTFVRETNSILETCDMGPLYIANPYESFILMCILAEDPLGAFADTIELSYNENDAT